MDPWTTGLMAVNVVGSLLGGLGASAARRRAEEARARALQDYLISGDAGLQALRAANAQGLWQATGQGGDALRALGGRLGSSLAAAGVYNSSATAGALQRAQEAQSASLADLAARNYAQEAQMQAATRQQAMAQQMGWSGQDIAFARDQEAAAKGALLQGMIGLAQTFAPVQKPAATKSPTDTQQSVLNLQSPLQSPAPVQAPALRLVSPTNGLQPSIQTYQQDWRSLFNFPSPRTYTPIVNGTRGTVLQGVRAPRVLYQPLRLG